MAEITAGMVKELRERTQAGMMDCKNALVEAGGDMARAAEIIQKKGLAKAVKAQGKIAADGMIAASVSGDGRHAVLVEVNCQTDFVARGEDFRSLVADVTRVALERCTGDVAALEAATLDGRTLRERADELTARSGEKHSLRRVTHWEREGEGLFQTYIHHGSRLGVLVDVASSAPADPRVVDFANDVALQIASMNPRYVQKSEVPGELVAKQREIFAAQMDKEDAEAQAAPEEFLGRVRALVTEVLEGEGVALDEGVLETRVARHLQESARDKATLEGLRKAAEKAKARPVAAREKILDGKVAKWLTEIVLLDQTSVKDTTKTIGQIQAAVDAAAQGTSVRRYVRYELGEGIEKAPAKDFAQEVAEMTGQKPS